MRFALVRFGIKIAVIGGGPAGLRAAEVASAGGASVTLFDAKPSVGRKFLVAGRGGLNLTHFESAELFAARYSGADTPAAFWPSLLADFDADALRGWAAGLGVETFAATSGRVYPREMKAAPLLRRWVHRLREANVHFDLRHRWTGLRAGPQWNIDFSADGVAKEFQADALILALGGGSWPETGSDGGWVPILGALGMSVAPLTSANCGWELEWAPGVLAQAEGKPIKNIQVSAAGVSTVGELLVTKYGLEGGAIYTLGPILRSMQRPELVIDFKPAFPAESLVKKLGTIRRNFLVEARSRWRLCDASYAILEGVNAREPFTSGESLAKAAKACPLQLTGPRPLAEAISSAGGIRWSELDSSLMFRKMPGVFAAGEMIDWDAPTGGYLMQGCFATGTRAATSALAWIRHPT